jgi:DNA-binding transcriptional ArsR family regulator
MGTDMNEQSAELIARRLRIMGQPLRLRLVAELRRGSATVSELSDGLEAVQQNVSQHLSILHGAGILTRRKQGTHAYYDLADPHALAMIEAATASVAMQSNELARVTSQGPHD